MNITPTPAQIHEAITKRSRGCWVVRVRHIDRRPGLAPGLEFYTLKRQSATKREAVAAIHQYLADGAVLVGGVVQITH